jgi:isocitrate lyase
MNYTNTNREGRVDKLIRDWEENPRWIGIKRPYTAAEVVKLSGSVRIDHTLARLGAQRFWELVNLERYVGAMGAMTGNQAIQQVQAGLKAIYLSGWQAQPTPISQGRCIRIRACIRRTVCRRQ